jgi:hypothetical protein
VIVALAETAEQDSTALTSVVRSLDTHNTLREVYLSEQLSLSLLGTKRTI